MKDTILIFLTDNGSDVPEKKSAFTAGMRGFKGSLYEGGHRVPCFIHAPESLVGKPRVIDALTAHIDLGAVFSPHPPPVDVTSIVVMLCDNALVGAM